MGSQEFLPTALEHWDQVKFIAYLVIDDFRSQLSAWNCM